MYIHTHLASSVVVPRSLSHPSRSAWLMGGAYSSGVTPEVPGPRHGRACHIGRRGTCASWSLGLEQRNQSPYGSIHCV